VGRLRERLVAIGLLCEQRREPIRDHLVLLEPSGESGGRYPRTTAFTHEDSAARGEWVVGMAENR